MKSHVSENMNQFRLRVREAWNQPYNPAYAMVVRTNDRMEAVSALRTFATELGARTIILDIDKVVDDEQRQLLARKGPRLVIMSGLDTMSPDDRSQLRDLINAGGQALPVVIWEIKPEIVETPAEEPELEDVPV